ncbi:MAG: cbb3-type cytochrome c oxidase N-terminal domain-containing protein, partial [Betaproteobacteria bacterium]
MSDFTNEFWSLYIAVITVVSMIACGVLLYTFSSTRGTGAEGETTGHTWDGDLSESNNPLPRWWMWMFFITILFGLVY